MNLKSSKSIAMLLLLFMLLLLGVTAIYLYSRSGNDPEKLYADNLKEAEHAFGQGNNDEVAPLSRNGNLAHP